MPYKLYSHTTGLCKEEPSRLQDSGSCVRRPRDVRAHQHPNQGSLDISAIQHETEGERTTNAQDVLHH